MSDAAPDHVRDPSRDPARDPAHDPSAYRHWVDEHVRFADLDVNMHANNGAFATYFEASRIGMFDAAREAIAAAGGTTVIVKLEIAFLAELHHRDRIRIGGRVAGLGRSSVRFSSAIFRGGACVAVSDAVSVILDRVARTSMEIPPAAREILSRFA